MRKLDVDSILTDDETITFLCECGSEITVMANEEDRCIFCDARYYAKKILEVWRLDEDDLDEDDDEEGLNKNKGDEEI